MYKRKEENNMKEAEYNSSILTGVSRLTANIATGQAIYEE
jgi:hypothetical protein